MLHELSPDLADRRGASIAHVIFGDANLDPAQSLGDFLSANILQHSFRIRVEQRPLILDSDPELEEGKVRTEEPLPCPITDQWVD